MKVAGRFSNDLARQVLLGATLTLAIYRILAAGIVLAIFMLLNSSGGSSEVLTTLLFPRLL